MSIDDIERERARERGKALLEIVYKFGKALLEIVYKLADIREECQQLQESMESVGISIYDSDGNMKPLDDIFFELSEAMNKTAKVLKQK